jgi:hypothetical protein
MPILRVPGSNPRPSAFRAPTFPRAGGGGSSAGAGSGPQGERGPPGPGITQAEAEQDGFVAVARIENAITVFDYLANDDVHFGDDGVPVGRYLAANSNNLREALRAALAANPSKILFKLPPGTWAFNQISEATGLRNNLIFDGIDPRRCRLTRTSGQFFLWANDGPQNLVFRNISFELTAPAPFSASINMSVVTNALIDNCHFYCNLSGLVADGTYHGVQILGGSNIQVRNCYAENSQFALSGLGRSVRGATFKNNLLIGGNDCGVSCCTSSGHTLRDVVIKDNEFRDLNGSNYIYVGDDDPSSPPDLMSDVEISGNVCSGEILDPFGDTVRMGIQVAFCDVNKRIKVNNNIVSNSNPEVEASIVRGIAFLLRSGDMTSAWDIEAKDNSLGFTGADDYYGLTVNGKNVTGLEVCGNKIEAGSRGLEIAGCSNSDIHHNNVENSTTQGMVIDSGAHAISDVRVRHNYIKTDALFKAAIQFTGDNNVTACDIEHNTLRSDTASVINSLTGGATLAFDYNYNRHGSNGLHASATPGQNTGNKA